MTNEDIKNKCVKIYAEILSANNRLDQIRKDCPHEETFVGKYEIRIGSMHDYVICSFCGKAIHRV